MRKLTLDVEDLAVESFATSAAGVERGTVEAHGNTCLYTCLNLDCSGECTTSCGGGTTSPDTNDTACGPGASDPNQTCGSDLPGCHTVAVWTGCNFSCAYGPCL